MDSRPYREGARHAATTPAIYCPPTVVGLHHADCLPILHSGGAFNPTLSPPRAKCRAAHFRMREVRQENRIDRSSIEGVRIESRTMNIRAVTRNGIPLPVLTRMSAFVAGDPHHFEGIFVKPGPRESHPIDSSSGTTSDSLSFSQYGQ